MDDSFFFFHTTATTEIYTYLHTLSLHDALPISLIILVHPAYVQDRDGAVPLLQQSHQRHPFVARAYADSAYTSVRVRDANSIKIGRSSCRERVCQYV